MRDTIVTAQTLLEEALDAEDETEVRSRIRTAIQLLDALEHSLDTIQEAEVFEEMVAEDERLASRLADLGVLQE